MQKRTFSRVVQGLLAIAVCLSAGLSIADPAEGIQFHGGSASLTCLLPALAERGQPEYPKRAYLEGQSAKLVARLTFRGPDLAPDIRITSDSQEYAFEESLRSFLKRYRLPCMGEGQAQIETTQEFVFAANDPRKIVSSNPQDAAKQLYLGCLVGTAQPNYPQSALSIGVEGNVIVDFKFKQRGEPPELQTVYAGGNRSLEEAALEAAKKYRYNCAIPAGESLDARQSFHFRIDGGPRYRLNDMGLLSFLRMAEKADLTKVKFNTSTMGCPFDLRVTLMRPFSSNLVGELEQSEPRRKEFIQWIQNITIDLPKRAQPYLIGDSVMVNVPCLALDFS